jgi:hypothetical protein
MIPVSELSAPVLEVESDFIDIVINGGCSCAVVGVQGCMEVSLTASIVIVRQIVVMLGMLEAPNLKF